jgi:methionyl-tRNA formyltransferase
MRLAFLGTPDAAVPTLEALVSAGHEVAIVITRPDRRRGRGGEPSPSPVKNAALALGLRVGHSLSELEGLDCDYGVVVAYGAIIPSSVLDRLSMFNVHFSLLPRWRGAAPVERAILAGDERTGVCVMSIEPTLDTGPVYAKVVTEVDEKTATELTSELAAKGAALLVEVLASPELLAHPSEQEGEATYAKKLTSEDYRLTPDMPVHQIARVVRLGRAYCLLGTRRFLVVRGRMSSVRSTPGTINLRGGDIVLHATDGSFILDEVQIEGSRRMNAAAWWSGARLDAPALVWS